MLTANQSPVTQEQRRARESLEDVGHVLSEALPDFVESPVHPHGDTVLGADGASAQARSLDPQRQGDVVHDGGLQRLVPADRLVGGAANQVAGSSAGREPAGPVEVRQEPGPGEERPEDVGHEDVLPEALRLHARKEGEQVGLALLQERHGLPQAARVVDHVRVREEQDRPVRLPRAEPQGVRLAEPARRRISPRDDPQTGVFARERLQDRPRPIRRAVVDDEDFEVRIVLRELRPDGGGDRPLLVARRDDDRDSRRRAGGRRGSGEARRHGQVQDHEEEDEAAAEGRRRQDGVNHARSSRSSTLSPRGAATPSHSPAVAARSQKPRRTPRSTSERTASPAARSGTNSRV